MLRKLLALILPDEWEGHYSYCNVFNDNWPISLTASGKLCSEDCFKHPGSKWLLGKYTKRVREV